MFSTPTTAQRLSDAYRVETFRIDRPLVTVKTSSGSVEVIGSSRSDVEVRMFVRKGSTYLTPKTEDLEDFEITIEQKGDEVIAIAKRKSGVTRWFETVPSISFVVLTPVESDVDASTSGGSMDAENLRGALSLRTSGGSIDIGSIEGETDLQTSGGSIDINGHRGTLTGSTSGGAIDLIDAEGRYDIKTSGGSIDIEGLRGSVKAHTSGGSIDAQILATDGPIELVTSGGGIDIELPSGQGYDLDLSGTKVDAKLVNFTGTSDRQTVKGAMNGGGTPVKAKTSGGTVSIRYSS